MRITLDTDLGSEGEVVGKHEVKDLPDAGLQPGKPYMSVNRSEYHDAEATHAFAATGSAVTNVQYKLALSGPPNYDTDDWSDPEEIESWVSGLVVRPLGSPRTIWPDTNNSVMSNSGQLEMFSSLPSDPCISVNQSSGKYEGTTYRDTYLSLRDVYICFADIGGDPGWDTDGDGYTDWYEPGVGYILDPYGNRLRDPGDLVQTIIFKQVDP